MFVYACIIKASFKGRGFLQYDVLGQIVIPSPGADMGISFVYS